jgi:hypothetical protein
VDCPFRLHERHYVNHRVYQAFKIEQRWIRRSQRYEGLRALRAVNRSRYRRVGASPRGCQVCGANPALETGSCTPVTSRPGRPARPGQRGLPAVAGQGPDANLHAGESGPGYCRGFYPKIWTNILILLQVWRREWDSNPRCGISICAALVAPPKTPPNANSVAGLKKSARKPSFRINLNNSAYRSCG